ncbi:uncharacterized protein ACBT57_018291 isoform 1-T1 [Dama dama]
MRWLDDITDSMDRVLRMLCLLVSKLASLLPLVTKNFYVDHNTIMPTEFNQDPRNQRVYRRERGETAKSAARKVRRGRCGSNIRSSGNRRTGRGRASVVRGEEGRSRASEGP